MINNEYTQQDLLLQGRYFYCSLGQNNILEMMLPENFTQEYCILAPVGTRILQFYMYKGEIGDKKIIYQTVQQYVSMDYIIKTKAYTEKGEMFIDEMKAYIDKNTDQYNYYIQIDEFGKKYNINNKVISNTNKDYTTQVPSTLEVIGFFIQFNGIHFILGYQFDFVEFQFATDRPIYDLYLNNQHFTPPKYLKYKINDIIYFFINNTNQQIESLISEYAQIYVDYFIKFDINQCRDTCFLYLNNTIKINDESMIGKFDTMMKSYCDKNQSQDICACYNQTDICKNNECLQTGYKTLKNQTDITQCKCYNKGGICKLNDQFCNNDKECECYNLDGVCPTNSKYCKNSKECKCDQKGGVCLLDNRFCNNDKECECYNLNGVCKLDNRYCENSKECECANKNGVCKLDNRYCANDMKCKCINLDGVCPTNNAYCKNSKQCECDQKGGICKLDNRYCNDDKECQDIPKPPKPEPEPDKPTNKDDIKKSNTTLIIIIILVIIIIIVIGIVYYYKSKHNFECYQ